MSEESESKKQENPGGIIKQTIDSATALTKAVPIYEDAVQPLAKETGKALGTVGKAVNVALAPISLVVWGYDQMSDFLENKVADKLALQDMFANLIANSLDSKTVLEAHPSFVDIIKNISPDEGMILKLFASAQQFPLIDVKLQNKKDRGFNILHRNVSRIGALSGCQHPQLVTNYLDNLCRLGILNVPSGRKIHDPKVYEKLTSDASIEQLKKQFENNEIYSVGFDQKFIEVTGIGRQFINACVIDKKIRG